MRVDHRVRRAGLAVALVGCALTLAACSGGSSGGHPSASGTSGASGAKPTPIAAVSVGSTTAVTPGDVAALPVLAQASTSTSRGVPLVVALNEVRVSGALMQVTFTVTNRGSAEGTENWQVAQFFADGLYQASGAASSADAESVDGVYVLDPKNAKRYLVARDQNKVCVCSGNTSSTFIKGGASVTFTGTYAAPPVDVTAVTVVIPKTPPFQNVSVQR